MEESNLGKTKKIARIDVRVSPDVKGRFSEICLNNGSTTSEVIRDFVYNKVAGSSNETNNIKHQSDHKNSRYYLTIFISMMILAFILFAVNRGPFVQEKPELNSPELKKIFNRIDKDSDSFISLDDLQKHKVDMIEKISDGYGPIDKVQRRRITLTELNDLFTPPVQFMVWDLNQDNKLDIDEFSKSYFPFKSQLFFPNVDLKILDTDESGVVTRDEIIAYSFKGSKHILNNENLIAWHTKHIYNRLSKNQYGLIKLKPFE